MEKAKRKVTSMELCVLGALSNIKKGVGNKNADIIVESFKKARPERFEELNEIVNG